MPTADEQVDAIARAAAEFENAATQLHAERAKLAQARGGPRRADRDDRTAQARAAPEAEAALAERERLQQALEEEFRDAGGDPAGGRPARPRADPGDRAAHRGRRTGLPRARRAGPHRARQGHRARDGGPARRAAVARRRGRPAVRAGRAVRRVRPARPAPARRRHGRRAVAGSRPLARRERAPARNWPPPLASAGEPSPDPAQPCEGSCPAGVTEILDAFAAATRGGRQVTEGTLKNTADRMSVALKDFTEALAACDEDYRVDWEPGARRHRARDRRRGPQAGRPVRHPDRRTRRRPGRAAGGPGTQGPRGRAARRARPADPRPGDRRPGPHPGHELRHQVQADVVRDRGRHPLGAVRQDHRAAAGHVPAARPRLTGPGTARRAARPAPRDDPGVPGRPPAGHLPGGAGQRARLPVLARVRAAADPARASRRRG